METIGRRIDETGTLIRSGSGFALRRDRGGRICVDLHRVPVEHVEKRVRIRGVVVTNDLIDVEGLAAV